MRNNQPTEQQMQTPKLHHVSSLTGKTEGEETASFVDEASNKTTGNPIEAVCSSEEDLIMMKMTVERRDPGFMR